MASVLEEVALPEQLSNNERRAAPLLILIHSLILALNHQVLQAPLHIACLFNDVFFLAVVSIPDSTQETPLLPAVNGDLDLFLLQLANHGVGGVDHTPFAIASLHDLERGWSFEVQIEVADARVYARGEAVRAMSVLLMLIAGK